jgi:A118 family predicted phage portal protein
MGAVYSQDDKGEQMDISAVVKKLNSELGMTIPTSYYGEIRKWSKWWQGKTSFHARTEALANGTRRRSQIYSLGMAKKICEDWASVLLNEKTHISVSDDSSTKWLQGDNETGGVFADISFWTEANALVEKAFYSGTGAFVLKVDGMGVTEDGSVAESSDARIRMEYLPAENIIPITVRYNQVTECAFASDVSVRGRDFVYVETHMIEDGLYVIRNRYYEYTNGVLHDAPLPEGVAAVVNTGSPIPFFAIIKPNSVNSIKSNRGLGCAVFANAIDNLKGVDLAYNNFNQDFYLGGKKVFYDRSLGESTVNADGSITTLAPDEVQQRLFWQLGDNILADGKQPIYEFNPSLRVEENVNGIQAQLDYLSFKCGLGTRYYKFDTNTGSITATQYTGEKQELKQNAAKHMIVIEKALIDIVHAMLWIGRNIIGAPVDETAEIKVEFSDGYIISDEERRARDLQEFDRGLLQGWEFRKTWRNEDEATAKAMFQKPTLFGDK